MGLSQKCSHSTQSTHQFSFVDMCRMGNWRIVFVLNEQAFKFRLKPSSQFRSPFRSKKKLVWDHVRAPLTYRSVCHSFMKFDVEVRALSSKHEFRENWLSGTHAVFNGVNEFIPVLFTFLGGQFWCNSLLGMCTLFCCKSADGSSYFSRGCRWNYISAYIMNSYDILSENNAVLR